MEDRPTFSPAERQRYARHFLLPDVGPDGQARLREAAVLCVGAGGLGSPVAIYLAAAGVGRLGLVDPDVVDPSNLQRQILYGERDVGTPKLEAAAAHLRSINPHVRLDLHRERFQADNAMRIAESYDVIVDGTDNFPTRYLSNDVAVLLGKPNVYGSIFRFEGQCSVFHPAGGGPCYRCMFPVPPRPGQVPGCAEAGVLGVLPGIVGCLQAAEAIKLLLGIGDPLVGRLLHVDVRTMRFREIRLRRDPACPACGESPSITAPEDLELACAGPPIPDAEPAAGTISVRELADLLDSATPPMLIDVREAGERAIASIAGARHVPLAELESRLGDWRRDAPICVHCKSGGRSARAVAVLRRHGFLDVRNVAGGIDAWTVEIDPSLPRY